MRKSTHRDYVLYLVLILALITLFWYLTGSRSTSSVSYSRMVQLFEAELWSLLPSRTTW